MKRAQVLILIIAAATLVAGCKHPAKPLTYIPGQQATPANANIPSTPLGGDQATRLRPDPALTGNQLPVTPATGAENLGDRPKDGANQNREILAQQTIYFDYDKSAIKANEKPKLEKVAQYLKDNPKASLIVEGNCDERGTPEYNRALGERRAIAARDYLVNSQHVETGRITTVSYGEDKPADDGHNEAAWSKNRRDDFVVVLPQP